MKRLLEQFPDAQFIHLIHDGRGCALSMFQRKHDFGVYNTFFVAKYWGIYVEIGQKTGYEIGSDNYHEIRYEDLLKNPQTIMKGVYEFLNEEHDDSLVNFKKSGEAGKTPLLQQPVQKQNQVKWRQKMNPSQILTFERAVSSTLRSCHYPITTKAQPLSLPTRAFWHLHNRAATRYYEWRYPR